jgi:hypothetical protein
VSVTGRTGATGWLRGAACKVRAAPAKSNARIRRDDEMQKGMAILSDYARLKAFVGEKIERETDVIK